MRFLICMWISLVVLATSQAQNCTGWFGSGSHCVYKCRCTSGCDNDGSCKGGGPCERPWFGPSCQYVDLASNVTVTTNPGNAAIVELTDGNDATCNTYTQSQMLTLKLDRSYLITWLRVYTNKPGSLSSLTAKLSADNGTTYINGICVNVVASSSLYQDMLCDLKLPVNQVALSGEAVKSLCSVYISGGRNIALRQNASQSSNYSSGGFTYGPQLAVDGNSNAAFNQLSCACTENISDSNWSVALSQPAIVYRYVVYNRDANLDRLKGFLLRSFGSDNVPVYNYTDSSGKNQDLFTLTPQTTIASVSRVEIKMNGPFLTLCEVEIYGETNCSGGTFGRECEKTCNCANTSEQCFVSTGGCTSGCAAGYIGEACKECPTGWFGSHCVYKCRCTSGCNTDGSCTGGGPCERPWFGPSCQYVDLASNVTVMTNPGNAPIVELTDSNDSTCITYTQSQTLTLKLDNLYLITWLRVYTNNSGSLSSLTAQFSADNGTKYFNGTCVNVVASSSLYQDMLCDLKLPVNQVALRGEADMSLCSVYISGGRNVALRQNASQSSTYSYNSITYVPELAVDGNKNAAFNQLSCTCTQPFINDSNWSVIISRPAIVYRYVVYNRDDSTVQYRLRGFSLTSFGFGNVPVYSYTDTSGKDHDVFTITPQTTNASVSRVEIETKGPLLTLCEVEIYGETNCSNKTFGRECEKACNCAGASEQCFVSTGGCTSGCAAGYHGEACTESCTPGTFGKDCKSNCSQNCLGNSTDKHVCDNINGTCLIGCQDGYISAQCNQSCENGTFSKNCKLNCSEFCVGDLNTQTCSNINGICHSGCQDGYMPPMCNETCTPGTFGKDCKSNCSQNCLGNGTDKHVCDNINGTCLIGCQDGYISAQCNQSCPNGKFGKNCTFECPEFCGTGSIPLCNNVNGTCQNGCQDGYISSYCNQSCQPGNYGQDCVFTCSQFCESDSNNISTCYHTNGTCLNGCLPGYHTATCDATCTPGTFGKDCKSNCSQNCLGNSTDKHVCDHINGTCLIGCQDGYISAQCNQSCPVGTFGPGCSSQCSKFCVPNNKNLSECDHVSGKCKCQDGYDTDLCNITCRPGKYGPGCSSACSQFCSINSTSCFYTNGSCLTGCQTGYTEPLCTKKIDKGTTIPVGAIIGAVVGAIVAAAVVAVAIILCRKKSKKHNRDSINREGFSAMSNGSSKSFSGTELTEMSNAGKSQMASTSNKTVHAGGNNANVDVYYNTLPALTERSPTIIPLKDLDTFLNAHKKSFYQEQFSTIPINNEATTDVAQRPENKIKNRYKNICPYDHSRVHLMSNVNNAQDGYINASHIQGYNGQESFIASQGPTKRTLEDFVTMLWEQDTEEVVMLTNLIEQGKEKSERYWPDDGEIKVGEITVKLTMTQVYADYTIRRLHLGKAGKHNHLVTHFHFTAWPDLDVPQTPWSLIDFEQRVASYPTSKPIVVHCSAGVGRTGTFIALRNAIKQAEDKGYLDIFTTVQKLRYDRVNMVQTATQYEFLHRAAQVAMLCLGTTLTSSGMQDRIDYLEKSSDSGLTNIENEFKIICTLKTGGDNDNDEDKSADDASNVYENSQNITNMHKNRLHNIIPKALYTPVLQCQTDYLGDYINAVFIPNFKKQNQHFLTQLPLPTTIIDFWRLVIQYKVSLIVSFEDDLKATDPTVGEYLPSFDNHAVTYSMFEIESQTISASRIWQQRKVTITAETEYRNTKLATSAALKEELLVTHLKCLTTKSDPENLLALIAQIRSLNPGGEGRIIYMCRNGADYSGLMCVLSLLLDRIDNDGCSTVPLVVGAIKAIRPEVISTLAQYKLLYEVLRQYSDSSNIYANLNHMQQKPSVITENVHKIQTVSKI